MPTVLCHSTVMVPRDFVNKVFSLPGQPHRLFSAADSRPANSTFDDDHLIENYIMDEQSWFDRLEDSSSTLELLVEK